MDVQEIAETTLRALRERAVLDVLVPGWVDRDGEYPEFRPQPVVVLLRLDSGFLRLESVGQFDQLKLEHVIADIGDPSGLLPFEAEDGDEVILASYGETLFGDGRDRLRCVGLRYVADDASDPAAGVVKCAEFAFDGGARLFADPTWTFGIRLVGGTVGADATDLGRWISDYGRLPAEVRELEWDVPPGKG
jgi:hypothetical protein